MLHYHMRTYNVITSSILIKKSLRCVAHKKTFILDSNTDMDTRKNMIITGVLRGKSKLLESIATSQKTKPVLIRFLQDAEQIVGADMAKYGPFKAEDVSSVPYDNAQAFISQKIASKLLMKIDRADVAYPTLTLT